MGKRKWRPELSRKNSQRPSHSELLQKPPFRAEKIGDKPDRVPWEDVVSKMKQIQEEHQIPIFAASLRGAATLWSGACVDDFNAGAYLNDDIRNLRDWRDVEKAGGAIIMNNAPYNGGGAAFNVDFPMVRDEFGEYFEGAVEIQYIESDTLPLDKIRQCTQELIDYINENGIQQYKLSEMKDSYNWFYIRTDDTPVITYRDETGQEATVETWRYRLQPKQHRLEVALDPDRKYHYTYIDLKDVISIRPSSAVQLTKDLVSDLTTEDALEQ